jgi:hypothetical protein
VPPKHRGCRRTAAGASKRVKNHVPDLGKRHNTYEDPGCQETHSP